MWEKTFDSWISWWHMNSSKKRTNANAFYSPGVDRFFGVDSFDPYTAYEIAKILSSKVPGIAVCVLTMRDPTFTSEDCHHYTLSNKSIFSSGASILYSRHTPALRKMQEPDVVRMDTLPLDYESGPAYDMLMELTKYTKFVIAITHAAKLCEIHFNHLPMEDYNRDFLSEINSDLSAPWDSINSASLKTGITREIIKLLYFSDSEAQAMAGIEELWKQNNSFNGTLWRTMFYKALEFQPESLKNLEMDTSRWSGYIL